MENKKLGKKIIKPIKPNGYGLAEREFINNIKIPFAKELDIPSITNTKLRVIFDNYEFSRTLRENRRFVEETINNFEKVINRDLKDKNNLKIALEVLEKLRASYRPKLKAWKIYSEQDIEYWIEFFEEIGTFFGVSKYLREKHKGKGPKGDTIKERIEERFNLKGIDFESWLEKYHITDFFLNNLRKYERIYNDRDVDFWINLFEVIGTYSAVSEYLKNNNNGVGPTRDTIRKRIIDRFEVRGLDYNRWLLIYYQPERAMQIGDIIHYILEYIFIEFSIQNGYNSFYEIMPGLYNKQTIVDNTMIFLNEEIKMVNIDYTVSKNLYKIINKFFKGYQGKEKSLIIVILTTNEENIELPNLISIQYRNNIRIMNAKEFANFMGYTNQFLYDYNYALNLTRSAFFDNNAFAKLKELGNVAKTKLKIMSQKHPINQEDLNVYLKNKVGTDFSYLLYESY